MFFWGLRPDGDGEGKCLDVEDGAEFVIIASTFSLSFPPLQETSFLWEIYPLDSEDFFAELCLDGFKDGRTGDKQHV